MSKITSDIVIIGAGITGITAAIFLARKGLKVVLLERGRIGNEASGRNGGGVRLQLRQAPERALAMQAPNLWREIQDDWGCAVEYIQGGGYRLISSQASHAEAMARVGREREAGLDVALLNADQTREHLPFLGHDISLFGCSYCASDGTANPLLAMQKLAQVAIAEGVTIKATEPVRALSWSNGRVRRVDTPQAAYHAEVFINTAGPWAPELTKRMGFDLPIEKKISKLMITEPVSPMLKGFVSFDNGYLRQAADGNFHIGIRSERVQSDATHIRREDFNHVGRWFPPRFPFLRQLHIIRAFAGITGWTPDEQPIIDVAPEVDNFYIATGYSAHGFCIGPVVGRLLSEWIVTQTRPSEFEPCRLSRF